MWANTTPDRIYKKKQNLFINSLVLSLNTSTIFQHQHTTSQVNRKRKKLKLKCVRL